MKILQLTIITWGFSWFLSPAQAQSDWDVLSYWPHRQDPGRVLYTQIQGEAQMLLKLRSDMVKNIHTKAEWQIRQQFVREELKDLLCVFPEKTPLNPKITGVLERPRLRVEKLYFESLPGYLVSAALFLPQPMKGPAPAILFCSGHSAEGFRSAVYQHMILNYVSKGFVVLAFDPIGQGERRDYLVEGNKPRFSPTHEHSYVGNQIFLQGISPAAFFVHDAIRALDYLETRVEVDVKLIGVTGRSGGGTQTAYLMAVDDRIAAAAPECYLTTFEALLESGGPQDAEQNIVSFIRKGMDLGDLVVARAPKPTLMITTTRDIFSIQGARNLYEEVLRCYDKFGVPQHFRKVEDDAPHQSTLKNREAAYAFFQEYLANPGSPSDEAVIPFSQEELWVSPKGNLNEAFGGKTLFQVQKDIYKPSNRGNDTERREELRKWLDSFSGFAGETEASDFIFSGAFTRPGYKEEKYLMALEGRDVPLVVLKPLNSRRRPVLLLDDEGKIHQKDSQSLAMHLLAEGHPVYLPDLSGHGELTPRFEGDAVISGIPLNIWYAGILTGKYPVNIRMEEIHHLLKWISNQNNSQKPISIAKGVLCTDLTFFHTRSDALEQIILIRPLITTHSLISSQHYHPAMVLSHWSGFMRESDLPEILALFEPAKIKILNPVLGDQSLTNPKMMEQLFEPFSQKPVWVFSENVNAVVADWLNP